MVLEATMICIDNSEWMRNGDYSPSRFQAQADAVNLICGAKTQSNPENTVGVLIMAGKGVRVLVTPTSDLGKILACMHGLEIGGEMNLAAGIQVAQLALKHRQNKKQQQRIIVFAGSPVNHEKKMLEMIGRKLKKNSVALDIVNFGEVDEAKTEKLDSLLAAVNNNDSSHIVHVPAGPNALSDVLISTPIFTGDGEGGSGFAAAAAAAAAGGASGYDFGVDPNLDPELALALRVSMEEERARQEAAAKKAAEDAAKQEKGSEQQAGSQDATMTEYASTSISEAENKTTDLMAITSSGTKKGELFLGDVNTQLKNKNITTDIKVDTSSNLFTTITVNEPAPGVKAILSFKVPEQTSGKVELQYLHEYAGISSSVGLKANPIVNFSSVIGTNALSVGADLSFDTKLGELTKSNAAVNFVKDDLIGSLTLNEKGDLLSASYYHAINPLSNTAVGVDISHRFSTKQNTFTLGTQHALDPLTTVKGRVTNSGKASALIQHEWRPKSLITISSEVDTKAIEKSAKIGLSLALKP